VACGKGRLTLDPAEDLIYGRKDGGGRKLTVGESTERGVTMTDDRLMMGGGTGRRLPEGTELANPWIRLGSYLLESVLVTVTLVIGWLIWAATTGPNGQTPAKRLLNLRVIQGDTLVPAGMGRMFWVRGLLAGFVVSLAATFTLGIILFMPFWDRKNQNLWDKVSNCYVVTDPRDAWKTRQPQTI
jgi:uncharacterized RDD family membrane protein YckC